MAETSISTEDRNILELIQKLDARVARLETLLRLDSSEASTASARGQVPAQGLITSSESQAESHGFELRFGEFGLGWIGIVILLFGIVFLLTYTSGLGYRTLSGILGYVATSGLCVFARIWREKAPYLSRTVLNSSLVLLYYSTVRLHYFASEPLIGSAPIGLSALLLVVAFQFYLALKQDSQFIAVLAIVMALITGCLSDTVPIGLPLLAVVSLLAVLLASRREWWSMLCITIVLVYCSHLLWLLSNPVMGHPVGAIDRQAYSLIYVFLCAAIFFYSSLVRKESSEPFPALAASLNSLGFSIIVSLAVYAVYPNQIVQIFFAAAALFLVGSMIQWVKTQEQLVPTVYTGFGCLALSIAAYGFAQIPALFLWLSLQSLLVISVALWFRSKILVVTNAIIFLIILAAYVTGFTSSDWVNFSFALVGHLSARIMNWQKRRLTLHTELLRNVYLSIGFVFVLYGVYHAVPAQYVTISWVAVAGCYFLISILLKNIKYRWLAVTSVLVTVVHLFLVDLVRLDVKYRVPAFLFVGMMSLVISLYYTKFRRLKTPD